MKSSHAAIFIAFVFAVCSALAGAARAQDSAPSKQDDHSHADMVARGNSAKGMAFDAAKTTHHFILTDSGGQIDVAANDSEDTASRDEIRHHLQYITQKFKAGDFDIPMFVHDQVPPGAPAMKRLSDSIEYNYVATERGGRVAISTKNAEALAAIHDFLRFQIREHRTGDKP